MFNTGFRDDETEYYVEGGDPGETGFYYVEAYDFELSSGRERFNWTEQHPFPSVDTLSGQDLVGVGLHVRAFGAPGFQLGLVEGSEQRDNIQLVQDFGARIETYGGNDLVRTGFGDDKVYLGTGNDHAIVFGGNNFISGGDGIDVVSFDWNSLIGLQVVQNGYVLGDYGASPRWEIHSQFQHAPNQVQVTRLSGVEWVELEPGGERMWVGPEGVPNGDFDAPDLAFMGGNFTDDLEADPSWAAEFDWSEKEDASDFGYIGLKGLDLTRNPFAESVHDLSRPKAAEEGDGGDPNEHEELFEQRAGRDGPPTFFQEDHGVIVDEMLWG